MYTPICDFVRNYNEKSTVRAHMPGHKGVDYLGFEHLDITEIEGADSLFEADCIIRDSEQNAGEIFSTDAFYSTEGSSLCIRAMLYLSLLYAKKEGKSPLILAGRNAHKTFLSSVALLDMEVEWLYGTGDSYLFCDINAQILDEKLSVMKEKPVAVYITSPDYLGNILDIESIAQVCKKNNVLLLVDNAHGAYLKFSSEAVHPIESGADICCDSAHKTLPVLTGGAYLHINRTADSLFKENAKTALSLFASTSPSYLILQSLDKANEYLQNGYTDNLNNFVSKVGKLKGKLYDNGYILAGNEPLKITICTKKYGYTGFEFAELLRKDNIECEFCDPDFLVMMLSPSMSDKELEKIKSALLGINKRREITDRPPEHVTFEKAMSIREAVLSLSETVDVKHSVGKVLGMVSVSCPPAVPIIVSGERIDERAIPIFEYYNIDTCKVVIE